MDGAETIAALREQVQAWRREGLVVGLVPTMGNLHEGHLSLIKLARAESDRIVASIFVNPLQFGRGEDFATYPRTPTRDSAALQEAGCDLLFAPTVSEMYPDGDLKTHVDVGALGALLCGIHREGHFTGMATVVVKLLNQVMPDVAVFGEKDFQQLVVIKQVVKDLDFPVRICSAPTVREPDGLAMSSRNRYLDPHERSVASRLHATLAGVAKSLRHGHNYSDLSAAAVQQLRDAGFRPDYVEVRGVDLSAPATDMKQLVVLAAGRLGRTRLIDNIVVTTDS